MFNPYENNEREDGINDDDVKKTSWLFATSATGYLKR
jgi:hypothetical protein